TPARQPRAARDVSPHAPRARASARRVRFRGRRHAAAAAGDGCHRPCPGSRRGRAGREGARHPPRAHPTGPRSPPTRGGELPRRDGEQRRPPLGRSLLPRHLLRLLQPADAEDAAGMSVGTVSLPRVAPRVQEVAWRGTLAGSALWLFSSNLLYAGCQWATVVGLAKLGSPAPLGHLGLALAAATPVVLITGFALPTFP